MLGPASSIHLFQKAVFTWRLLPGGPGHASLLRVGFQIHNERGLDWNGAGLLRQRVPWALAMPVAVVSRAHSLPPIRCLTAEVSCGGASGLQSRPVASLPLYRHSLWPLD